MHSCMGAVRACGKRTATCVLLLLLHCSRLEHAHTHAVCRSVYVLTRTCTSLAAIKSPSMLRL